jgi:hypothetical protein
MADEKPKDVRTYIKWLKDKHGIQISPATKKYYESVTYKVKRDFEQSPFWTQVTGNLKTYDEEYLARTGYRLLVPVTPEVLIKPYGSFFEKTRRKNVVENKVWPNSPPDGWILPTNWYSRINDIVRTLFVVKYLDGPQFLAEKVRSLCGQLGLDFEMSYEARVDGYYAVHLSARRTFEIPKPTYNTERVDVSVEIQISTQLQEVIRKMLHKYYKGRRAGTPNGVDWQWDYKGEEFAANYLGHILHYVEGMIMEIREKQGEKKP